MNYKNFSKYFLFLLVFVILAYIAIVFHVNYNNTEDFDKLYAGLKNAEKKEGSFKKFTSVGEKACDYLLNKLPIEEDALIKSDILQIISYANCSNCGVNLVPFLYDPDWRVRFFAVDALNKLEYKRLIDQLPEVILNDPNENVKIGAIMILGERGNTKDIKFLENLASRKKIYSKKYGKAIDIALDELRSKSGDDIRDVH